MNRFVGGHGPLDARICMIGEAPRAEEERLGKPFVGKSGKLLTQIMHGLGLSRDKVYITNVIKERPPRDDIGTLIKFDNRKGVSMTPAYIEHEQFLYEELSHTKANVYVAIGNVALWALCRQDKITKRRGSILKGSEIGDKKVIPIIHPASALRNYIFTHFIRFDLRRAIEESAFPELRPPSRNLIIGPLFLDTIAYIESCRDCKKISYDIEVVNEEVSCISIAKSPYDCISIPFYADGRDWFTVEQEAEVWKAIASLLEEPEIEKIGHNVTFDSTFLFIKYGIRPRNLKDTMVSSGICYPDFPKGLDFVTSICTKEPYYKEDGKKWFKIGGSIEDFWAYNAKDSAVCLESYDVLEQEVQRQQNERVLARQLSIIPSLVYMQTRGIQADKVGMDTAHANAELRIDKLQDELNTLCGYDINPNRTKQLKEYFYIRKGIKPYISRSTGNITVDATALKRLSKRGFKEASIILEMRHLLTINSRYFEMEMEDDNRIRCSFNPVGTENGRLSSSKTIFGKGGNMQNLPPEMLSFLVADPGCFLYNIDLSQAENRIVAYIAPEPNMISAFEKGVDIHRQTAGLIFNKAIEDVSDEPGSSSIGNGMFSERFWGKKADHALDYDLGYRSFALLNEIPDSEAKYIVERFHTVYPGVRQYHAWVRAQLGKGRTIENCLGRKRLFTDRWGDGLFREAYAFIPQSTVADIINERGLDFVMDNPAFRGLEILNQVHDSLVVQISHVDVPVSRHAEMLCRLVDNLERTISYRGMKFTIPVEIKVGLSLDKKKMTEVSIYERTTAGGLARVLSNIHETFRATSSIQNLDSCISNSRMSSQKV